MEIERIKKVIELMIKNDVPMGNLIAGVSFPGYDNVHLSLSSKLNPNLSEYEVITREFLCIRDIYDKINIEELDEDTGRKIIERNKPLIKEYYEGTVPIWENYFRSGFKAQEIPRRLKEINSFLQKIERTEEYQNLSGYKLYVRAWEVGYITKKKGSRSDWFVEGKPVIHHPEKLKLLL